MSNFENLHADVPGMSPRLCTVIPKAARTNQHPDTFVDKDPATGRLLLGCVACAAWALIEAEPVGGALDITTTIEEDCPFEK